MSKQLSDLDFNNISKVINLPIPTISSDAANKFYVDNTISGTVGLGGVAYTTQYILPSGSSVATALTGFTNMTGFSLTTDPLLTLKYIILLNIRISCTAYNRWATFNLCTGVGATVIDSRNAIMHLSGTIYSYDFSFYHTIAPATNVKIMWNTSTAGSTVTASSLLNQRCNFTIFGIK